MIYLAAPRSFTATAYTVAVESRQQFLCFQGQVWMKTEKVAQKLCLVSWIVSTLVLAHYF